MVTLVLVCATAETLASAPSSTHCSIAFVRIILSRCPNFLTLQKPCQPAFGKPIGAGVGQNSSQLALILTFSPWEKEQSSTTLVLRRRVRPIQRLVFRRTAGHSPSPGGEGRGEVELFN